MKILMLAQDGNSTAIVYNKLRERFHDVNLIVEQPANKKLF